MTVPPIISVVMPVYNAEKYLNEAIDSILSQTFTDFEFIIINDGSSDGSEAIILSYDDERIRYIKNNENLQIVKSLNKGITLAKGQYIARMDADDVSLPERLEKQLAFMGKNANIDACGTWMGIIGESNHVWSYPEKHEEIKAQLLFNTPMSHPTLLFKKSFFDDFLYKDVSNKAEDYYLWCESIDSKVFANIPNVLYLYRFHLNQTCNTDRDIQVSVANDVRIKMLKRLGLAPTASDMKVHIDFSLLKWVKADNEKLAKWFDALVKSNQVSQYLDENALKKVISAFWWKRHRANKAQGWPVFFSLISCKYHKYDRRPIIQYIVFFIKCVIRGDVR